MSCSAIPFLKWGKENETVAVSQYSNLKCHANQSILHSGLIVNPKHPWLRYNPDGIVKSERGIIEGCLEVKCPYFIKDKTIKEAMRGKSYFLYETDFGPQLKKKIIITSVKELWH